MQIALYEASLDLRLHTCSITLFTKMLLLFLSIAATVSTVISLAPSVDQYFVRLCMDSK